MFSLIPPVDLAATRQPLSFDSFSREIVPSLLLYYATAVLVITPNTLPARLAMSPITLWALFRSATRIDLVEGWPDYERLVYLNQGLLIIAVSLAIRVCIWTFQREPYTRSKPSRSKYADAFDLCINMRGIGWSWSAGLKLPAETRNTTSRPAFLLSTTISLILHLLASDPCYLILQSFGPHTLAAPQGGSIYDSSLPLPLSFIRNFIISALSGTMVYLGIQSGYQFCTIIGVLLGNNPSSWPPLFSNPFTSTSVFEFWSRWHQLFRQNFIEFGGKPMMLLVGRLGGIFGAFFVSGVLHYLGLWGMGRGADFIPAVGYFMIQGVGITLELTYRSISGRRVQGVYGFVWAWLWVVGWGIFMTEAWSVRGLMGSKFLPDDRRPAIFLVRQVRLLLNSLKA